MQPAILCYHFTMDCQLGPPVGVREREEIRLEAGKRLLTVGEVAHRLGLSRSFTYELILKGEIPSIKIGRARRVAAGVLEEYVARLAREAEAKEV